MGLSTGLALGKGGLETEPHETTTSKNMLGLFAADFGNKVRIEVEPS